MAFVDFAEVKASTPIETVIDRLDLKMKRQGAQWRGPCPICRSGGDRALVVTPGKAAFYCFAAARGGDVIALVAHALGLGMKEAAQWIAGAGEADTEPVPGHVPNDRKGTEGRGALQPLQYLDPGHEALRPLGLAPETLAGFEAGFAPRGIMRGRLAIPIHDAQGILLAYAGRAISDDQEPKLIFPANFDPSRHLFNAHRIAPGPLTLARDPLAVLGAFEAGINNVVAILTDTLTAPQLELVIQLMQTANCESVEIF